MQTLNKVYIDGDWISSSSTDYLDIINPATEEKVGSCISGNKDDVNKAASAAKSAFTSWSAKSVLERCCILENFSTLYIERQEDIAKAVSLEMGMPISLARKIHGSTMPQLITETIQIAKTYAFEEMIQNSQIIKEAYGVVGAITPWNNPVYMMMLKALPAMAAGCTIVHKPAEISPLNAYLITELLHASGIPKGVFNLVPGKGGEVGNAISGHGAIDLVSFTGSTNAGKEVAKNAAKTAKKVILELGGKSACIVLDDADIKETVSAVIQSVFNNNGQMCGAWTRLLVPENKVNDYIENLVEAAKKLRVGTPDDPNSTNGPLASKDQYETVTKYIKLGIEEGATIAAGGLKKPSGFKTGYYVQPTIFTGVKNTMRVAQEEIFGPVLCVIAYKNEQDAVDIANDSVYGLRGAVFSEDKEHANAVARRIRTGQVDLNGYKMQTYSPFGGYKMSGYGRCQGRYGFEEFLQIKSIQL